MASCDNFKITVEGTSAHGSAPHLGHERHCELLLQ